MSTKSTKNKHGKKSPRASTKSTRNIGGEHGIGTLITLGVNMKNGKLGAGTKSIKSDYKWTLRTLGATRNEQGRGTTKSEHREH